MTDLGIWANNLKLLPRPAFKVVKNDPEAAADHLFSRLSHLVLFSASSSSWVRRNGFGCSKSSR